MGIHQQGLVRQKPHLSATSFLKTYDDWAFLKDQSCATFSELVEAETGATRSFFKEGATEFKVLEAEASRLVRNDVEAEAQGPYMYFQRTNNEGFLEFGRYPKEQPGEEEVILDTKTLMERTGYADITACKVSDDHELLAYIVDFMGDDTFELRLHPIHPEAFDEPPFCTISGVRSVEFLGRCGNSVSMLAVRTDAATKRAHQAIHVNVTGHNVSERLLWDESNPAAYLELFKTKNRKFILVSSNTKDTSEVRYARCNSQDADLTCLLEPRPGVEYFAEHQKDYFIVISNHDRRDFAVYTLPEKSKAADTEESFGWSRLQESFRPPGEMHVTDADLVSQKLVLYGHEAAEPRIYVVPLEAPDKSHVVDLPPIGLVEPGVNADQNASYVRFTLRSPVQPGRAYNLDLSSGGIEAVAQMELGVTGLRCERLNYPARDGELVPITILHSEPRLEDSPSSPDSGGGGPCLLHVYGAYGSCATPDFLPEHLLLVKRGWLLAWAHVRGGGERGWAWHQSGRKLKKSRSVLDLADATRFLLARGMVTPGALCLKGSSAGGLTLGSLLNSREDSAFIGAVILEVPFLDVLNSMADPLLPLTAHEFAEWGDPRNAEEEMNIRSLSPYENIGSHSYPPIYVSCALADARAPAWMAMKYAARLRSRMPHFISSTGHSLS